MRQMKFTRAWQVPNRGVRNRGFSLVELMLALALGLLVIAGIVRLFSSNSETYAVLNSQARLQENARFAFDFVSRSARTAGYFGCAPEPANIVRGLRGGWAQIPEYNMTQTVQGHEGGTGGSFSPSLNSLPGGTGTNVHISGNGIDTSTIVDGTDVLVLRSLRNARRLAEVLQPNGTPVVTAPNNQSAISAGDVALVADCEQAALFHVSNVATASNKAQLTVASAAAGGLFENRAQVDTPTGLQAFSFSPLSQAYGREAVLGRVETTVFYIAPSVSQDNRGVNPLALWQKQGSAAPVELVVGIEDMEILYGVDTTLNDGIANANQYLEYNNVADPAQIVALRVTLAVNSVDTLSAIGGPLRRTFSKTLLLRNATGGV